MDNPKVFKEYFDKYADLFCLNTIRLKVEKQYADEMDEDDDFPLDDIMKQDEWRVKIKRAKNNLKQHKSQKLREEFEKFVIKNDKTYLDPFATIPAQHIVNGYCFRDLVRCLDYYPPISESGDAFRIQSQTKEINKKHRDDETVKYLRYCQEHSENIKRPFNMEDIPDVYNFYDAKDDCFRLVKMGAYHKDFKDLKYVSKMKLKQKIQEGNEEDKKSNEK